MHPLRALLVLCLCRLAAQHNRFHQLEGLARNITDLNERWAEDDQDDYDDDDKDWNEDDYSQEDEPDDDWVSQDSSQADSPSTASPVQWNYYGNRFDLNPTRPRNKLKQSESRKVQQHTLYVSREGACKIPKKRLIDVQSHYPDTSKKYTPHCTVLHRCGDDIGCCIADSLTCRAKTTETVDLYFYTTNIRQVTTIEKLQFENHTECECVPKRLDSIMNDDLPASTYRSRYLHHEIKVVNVPELHTEAPINLKKCQCPSEFSIHMLDSGDCECDCFNKQKVCMRIKKGKEHFGLKDRICIQNGECQTPLCEFGDYIRKAGRCPRKHERNDDTYKHSRMFKNA